MTNGKMVDNYRMQNMGTHSTLLLCLLFSLLLSRVCSDYEDPDNWIGAGAETGRNHKTGRLEEYDPNDKWDLPPKRTQTQIVDDLHESRRVKVNTVPYGGGKDLQ